MLEGWTVERAKRAGASSPQRELGVGRGERTSPPQRAGDSIAGPLPPARWGGLAFMVTVSPRLAPWALRLRALCALQTILLTSNSL
jgi:hypothetical protein